MANLSGNGTKVTFFPGAYYQSLLFGSNVNPAIGDIVTSGGLGFAVANGITGTKSGFVRAGNGEWTKIEETYPATGGNWVEDGVTAIVSGSLSATSHNRVLFGVDTKWSYKSYKPSS